MSHWKIWLLLATTAMFAVACGDGSSGGKGPPKLSQEVAFSKCEEAAPRAIGPTIKYDTEAQLLDAWEKALRNCMAAHRYDCVDAGPKQPCAWTPMR